MKIPSPQACGLPEKFAAWRPAQEEALQRLLSRQVRIRALSAPTGFGKTVLYVAWALLSKLPTAFVTESRPLQDQLMRDFEGVGLVDLRGRQNYRCSARPGWTCEEGYAARCLYKGTAACDASHAEMRAATSYLVVTNYDKWTHSRKFGQGLAHIEQVVFDEGHSAPDALSRAMQVVLHDAEVSRTLGMDFPSPTVAGEMVNWKPWATEARGEAQSMMEAMKAQIAASPSVKPSWIKQFIHLRNLVKRLATLATATPEDWIVDEVPGGYQFDPIRPGRYAEGALLLRVPSILFTSATIRPKTMYLTGIAKENFIFEEFASDFPADRSPLYYLPTMRVDAKAESLAPLWRKLQQIAGQRKDRRGIVHTISYRRRDEILANIPYMTDRMLFNLRGEAAGPVLTEFRTSPDGTILVSPSVATGYDFPGRQCEWQFVCKVPFPDTRSKIIQARNHDDPEYTGYLTISKLEQIVGRATRSRTDGCENFICDEHMGWFYRRFKHLASKTFRARFREVTSVPPPPPRLPV
jgi:Rad3-related DNA helicase